MPLPDLFFGSIEKWWSSKFPKVPALGNLFHYHDSMKRTENLSGWRLIPFFNLTLYCLRCRDIAGKNNVPLKEKNGKSGKVHFTVNIRNHIHLENISMSILRSS